MGERYVELPRPQATIIRRQTSLVINGHDLSDFCRGITIEQGADGFQLLKVEFHGKVKLIDGTVSLEYPQP